MKVYKFGGSSVKDANKIKNCCDIVKNESKDSTLVVIFSAMKGITNLLVQLSRLAKENSSCEPIIDKIREMQIKACFELFGRSNTPTEQKLLSKISELEEILNGVSLIKECSARSKDLILSFGERLNCRLIADYFNHVGIKSTYIDARDIVKTDDRFGNATLNQKLSDKKIVKRFETVEGVAIVTGFIASNENGETTTLGRDGSDFSASIFAHALDAKSVEIWTDVDGILSADPRIVKNAFPIDEVSYEEAMELSFFGAEVIHPSTMIPAIKKSIPIWIKNSLNPKAKGTKICDEITPHKRMITGIASISNVALINVEGGGLVGKPGMAGELFTALSQSDINIIMISQASSEHSICFCCKESQVDRVKEKLNEALKNEIKNGLIKNIDIRLGMESISIIGDNIRGKIGIAGRIFSTLGENAINIFAIAQGSSERSISFITRVNESKKAIQSIHLALLG